jgi:hypothetical protein
LSPEQQVLYNQQNQMSQKLNQTALEGIDYVAQTANTPLDLSALPDQAQNLDRTNFQGQIDPTSLGIQGNYDFSGVSQMPKYEDFAGARDQITDAYMQRLQPYMDRDREAQESKLANQGITQGSEAYGWDRGIQDRGFNDQRIAALLAGDQQQQNLFQNAMNLRGQGISEAISQGNFGNQAQQQQFGQNAAQMQAANQAAEAQFGQGLAAGNFQNQARAQALQEQDYLRNQPLNMLNALRTGNQVNMPQFGNVSAGNNYAAAPIYQAANDQYSAANQAYQSKLQQQQAMMSGLAQIGGSAMMLSDRRLKKNIELLYRKISGLGVYAFDYVWGGARQIGLMADEVAKIVPQMLGPTIAGYASVNYGDR